jgi:GT2 family glycosyltransferase
MSATEPDAAAAALRSALEDERRRADEWQRIADERRRQLERIRRHPLFRLAARVLSLVRRSVWVLRRAGRALAGPPALVGRSLFALPRRARARRGLRRLVDDVDAATRSTPRRAIGEVTALIVTRDQPARLARLLAALARADVPVVVVENDASAATRAVLDAASGVTRVASTHLSYAAANRLGLASVLSPWVLLLNDDVEPVGAHWLDELAAAVTDDTVAVGAQLVHAARGWLGGRAVDGTVQHDGIAFRPTGSVPRPFHVGRGRAPEVTRDAQDVVAVTGACMLARMDALEAVGGFATDYDYGAEDVDLCLRLGRLGRVRVAHRCVLLHDEGATRLRGGSSARAARQARNWHRFDERNGPQVRRAVALDRLGAQGVGAGAWSTEPYRVVLVGGARDEFLGDSAQGAGIVVRAVRPGDARAVGDADAVVVLDPSAVAPPLDAGVSVVAWLADTADTDLERWGASGWLGRADRAVADGSLDLAGVDPTLPVAVRDRTRPAVGELAEALRVVEGAPRWSVRIGAPDRRAAPAWGDTHLAEGLAAGLRARGARARVATVDEVERGEDLGADVTVHLKGRGVAPTAPGQRNVVWVMSHPSEIAPEELDRADHVAAASERLATHLRARTATPVVVLAQATDLRRFVPGPADPRRATRLLFVGNTRSIARPAVMTCVEAGLPITIIGAGWERFVDPALVRHRHVPNEDLAGWYRSADIVLNDHWDDMRTWGIVSNRILDVLASGACVVSDHVEGLEDLVGDSVPTYRDADDLVRIVTRLLDDPEERARRADRGGRRVRAEHGLTHRARALEEAVGALGPEVVR